MGIPGFNVWFSQKYKNSYVPLGHIRVDHLYIDLNSVLHTVMRRARNHEHFHKLLYRRLNEILEAIEPTKSVMIAVDGPAPLAKLILQRERRKKCGRDVEEGVTLTSVAITPGTTFMLDLTHSLAFYCCSRMSSRRFRNVVFEVSDGTVKGEGETKILGRLARHWYTEMHPSDTHVIVGDDADLVLMALTSFKDNLFVANTSLNGGRLSKRDKIFSVDLLHKEWVSTFLRNTVLTALVTMQSTLLHAKLDLTLIAIMSKGNDYLPSLRGVSLETGGGGGLWTLYRASAQTPYHPDGNAEPKRISMTGFLTAIDPDTGIPRLDLAALAKILILNGVNEAKSGKDDYRPDLAAADPRRYLHGCVWLLQMYRTGECPDYRFLYDGAAPKASAVLATCQALLAEGHSYVALDTFGSTTPRARQPLLPISCALALLPAKCSHLAVPCVRHLMKEPSSSSDVNETDSDHKAGVAGQLPRFSEGLYYDLFNDCFVCKRLSEEARRVHQAYIQAKEAHELAVKRFQDLGVGMETDDLLRADMMAAEQKAKECKQDMSQKEQERKAHIATAHAYRPFPVEELESVAEAVLATSPIGLAERCATQFGTPGVFRAFASANEAVSFIRGQTRQLPQSSLSWTRQFSTQTNHPRHDDYSAIFTPPQPPFEAPNPQVFAHIVRQEVLNDEYGSPAPVQLRVAASLNDGTVRYLTQTPAPQGPIRQRQRVGVVAATAAAATVAADGAVAEVVMQTEAVTVAAEAVAVVLSAVESHKRSRETSASPLPADSASQSAAAAASGSSRVVNPLSRKPKLYMVTDSPADGSVISIGRSGKSGVIGAEERPSGSSSSNSKQRNTRIPNPTYVAAASLKSPTVAAAAAVRRPDVTDDTSGGAGLRAATAPSTGLIGGSGLSSLGRGPAASAPPMPSISLLKIALGENEHPSVTGTNTYDGDECHVPHGPFQPPPPPPPSPPAPSVGGYVQHPQYDPVPAVYPSGAVHLVNAQWVPATAYGGGRYGISTTYGSLQPAPRPRPPAVQRTVSPSSLASGAAAAAAIGRSRVGGRSLGARGAG